MQANNPWEEQYACLDSPDLIRARIVVKPAPLNGLNSAPPETAVNLFYAALASSYIPTAADINFIQMLIGSARAHAREHYADIKMFKRNLYAKDRELKPASPYMLCGQAGVGKSALVSAIGRLFEQKNSVQVEPLQEAWGLVPTHVVRILGTQSLAEVYRSFIDLGRVSPEDGSDAKELTDSLKPKGSAAQLLLLALRRLYQTGCCLIGGDEFQFLSLSTSANTLVTKTLLGLTYLCVPQFFVGNFSLLHRLLKRNAEEVQRLLTKIVVLEPDPPGSEEWIAHLAEYQRLAESVLDFPLSGESHPLWNMTAGLKRNLLQLLTCAYRSTRQSGRYKISFQDVEDAYASPAFGVQRRDVELLIRQAIEGRPARSDLWCPIEIRSPRRAQYRDALISAREAKVAEASTKAALTASENRIAQRIEKRGMPKVDQSPTTRGSKTRKEVTSATSLIQAANLFTQSRKK